jgi:hypothetical protein
MVLIAEYSQTTHCRTPETRVFFLAGFVDLAVLLTLSCGSVL